MGARRIQLTLGQHGMELHGSRYTQIFFGSKYYSVRQFTVG